MRTLAGPDRIAKFFSASDLKEFHVNMSTCWNVTKIEGKNGSLTNVSRVLPKIILKYGYLQNERRHEFCNPDTILVFIIIGAETRPCVVSRGPIHLFYFQVCLLSLFCIKSYLCIWYVREGKILVNLDVAWLKGNMKMFFKKWFLAWFINPVSVELQLTLETKFEWAISNLSGNNGKNGSALTKKLLLSQIKL